MNIDQMLYNEAKGLVLDSTRSVGYFVDKASRTDLRQQDWDTFWKGLRAVKSCEINIIK